MCCYSSFLVGVEEADEEARASMQVEYAHVEVDGLVEVGEQVEGGLVVERDLLRYLAPLDLARVGPVRDELLAVQQRRAHQYLNHQSSDITFDTLDNKKTNLT